MNGTIKTFILLAALTALFMAIGGIAGGGQGALLAFFAAMVMNLAAWWRSDKLMLSLYKGRQVDAASMPALVGTTQVLAEKAGLPMPKVYVIDNAQPNAFATGATPEKGAVAVTTGLLERLDTEELAGVLAHELAHIKNRDTLTMTVTASIAGALGYAANMLMFAGRRAGGSGNSPLAPIVLILVTILAPLMASLVQMAISRAREYEADRVGAHICGNPTWLANALEKIERAARVTDNAAAEQNPATAHLFIINPLHVHAIDGLFRTHPRTEERIQRLRSMVLDTNLLSAA